MAHVFLPFPIHLAGAILLLVLGPIWGAAPKGSSSDSTASAVPSLAPLDTVAVRKLYLEGDFETAIDKLEMSLKYDSDFSHKDSVFVFKHLGVMYAAKYETREKGKLFMHKLLETEPTARIMDMYASDMIYMIFKNIQDEFHSMNPGDMAQPEPRPARQEKEPAKEPAKAKRSYAWMGWTAGALAAAGGVALGIHMLQEDSKAPAGKELVSND